MSIHGPGKPRDIDRSSKPEEAKSEPKAKREDVSAASGEAQKKNQGIKGFAKKMLSSVKNAKNKLLQKSPSKSQDVEVRTTTDDILFTDSKIDKPEKGETFAKKIEGYDDFKGIDLRGTSLDEVALSKILSAINEKAEGKSNEGGGKLQIDLIDLSDNTITEAMTNTIRDQIDLQSEITILKQLVLKNTELTDMGAKRIADRLKEQKNLETVDLTGNKLSFDGARDVIDKLVRDGGEDPVSVSLTLSEADKAAIEEEFEGKNINVIINPAPNGP